MLIKSLARRRRRANASSATCWPRLIGWCPGQIVEAPRRDQNCRLVAHLRIEKPHACRQRKQLQLRRRQSLQRRMQVELAAYCKTRTPWWSKFCRSKSVIWLSSSNCITEIPGPCLGRLQVRSSPRPVPGFQQEVGLNLMFPNPADSNLNHQTGET